MSDPVESPSHKAESLLHQASSDAWAPIAADDLDATLVDHAHCEKKASASALALINDYPEDEELVSTLARLAEEEIGHFREVHERLRARGVTLTRDRGDPYAQQLFALMRKANEHRKLDRLLVAALIEARSCERFRLLNRELERRGESDVSRFLRRLEASEAGHAALFVRLAEDRFGPQPTRERLKELAEREAEIVATLPLLPRIH